MTLHPASILALALLAVQLLAAAANPVYSEGIDKCKNAFIDLGSNRGDSIRKFVTPNAHGGSLASFFQQKNWNPKEFCVFGIEGNPVFDDELTKMTHELTGQVAHIKVFKQAVAVADEKPVTFYIDTVNPGQHFWGSSILEHHTDVVRSGKKKVIARGINVGKLARHHVDPAGILMIKMDIEGAEYDVLRDLMTSGDLCYKDENGNNLFDFINVEFHTGAIGNDIDNDSTPAPSPDEFAKMFYWIAKKCGVVVNNATD